MQALALYLTGIHDAIVAEMSPSGCDGEIAKRVVDDFAARAFEHIDRVRAGSVTDDDPQDQFLAHQFAIGLGSRNDGRVFNRRKGLGNHRDRLKPWGFASRDRVGRKQKQDEVCRDGNDSAVLGRHGEVLGKNPRGRVVKAWWCHAVRILQC